VVWADWLFTTTTIVFQPLSGLYLLHILGLPWTTPWVLWTFVLYAVAGACWIPVVVIPDAAPAAEAASRGEPLPAQYMLPAGGGWPWASRRSRRWSSCSG
jgi:uncharacterized membrane protein